MKKGDLWREPQRGSRYSFNSQNIFYKCPGSHEKIIADSCSSELLDNLLDVKHSGGSFLITERGKVITWLHGKWIFVMDYDESLKFEGVDLNPGKELQSGDIWPGFYYNHGARFSLSTSDRIFLRRSYGRKDDVISNNDDLIAKLRQFLPYGGRFYINEHGKVWTNIRLPMNSGKIKRQIEELSNIQKNLLNQRVASTSLMPIYVCDYIKQLLMDLTDFSVKNEAKIEEDWWTQDQFGEDKVRADEAFEDIWDKGVEEIDSGSAEDIEWSEKGLALSKQGRYKEAANAYMNALTEDPYDKITWFNLGCAFDELSRNKLAIKAYDFTLEIDPEYIPALINKGFTLYKMKHYNEAIIVCVTGQVKMGHVWPGSKWAKILFDFSLVKMKIKDFLLFANFCSAYNFFL